MSQEIIIQFDLHDDRVSYIGRIVKIYSKTVRVQHIDPKGKWVEKSSYPIERIRTIQFNNDYINSLIAYNKWINKK